MAWHDLGNKPISSTGFVPIAAGSTTALFAELDSTMLGTVNFTTGQSRLMQVTYILTGGSSVSANITWQAGTCGSTATSAGVDEFYASVPPGQTAQYVLQHTIEKDYRIRVRQFSTGASGAAYIQAVALT